MTVSPHRLCALHYMVEVKSLREGYLVESFGLSNAVGLKLVTISTSNSKHRWVMTDEASSLELAVNSFAEPKTKLKEEITAWMTTPWYDILPRF